MPEPILVNILLPTYEPNPLYIREAVESVLSQTEKRWTLLIHDDASQADVRGMIESCLHDPRIKFERSEKRLGIGGNWNACVKLTDARFIQFLFQDDQWEPTYLERALAEMQKNEQIGMVFTAHEYLFEGEIPSRGEYEKVRVARDGIRSGRQNGKEFLRSWLGQELHPNLIGEPSFVLLRRSIVNAAGPFDETMPQFLDVDMWIRMLLQADVSYVSDTLGSFRVHPSSASSLNEMQGIGIYDRLRCFERLIRRLPSGDLRHAAVDARDLALATMARKFFDRLKGGRKVSTRGGGQLKSFALQHPLLTLRALAKGWRESRKTQ